MSRTELTPDSIVESIAALKRAIRQRESLTEGLRQADSLGGRGAHDERASVEKKIRAAARRLMVSAEEAYVQIKVAKNADGTSRDDHGDDPDDDPDDDLNDDED